MSSYNTRYSARYKDLEIEIKKLDYTGSSNTITHLAPQPIELSYTGDKGERKYVQGSSLTFSFYELNGEDYDEIFDSDYRDYKLLLRNYDSSTVVWEGYIKPENLTKSYLDYHKLINLQATDAIADLKDIPFEKVGGRVPILNVVKNALSYTGIELPIEIQLNTWETSHMTEGECPIEKAYIDTRKFYALKDGKTEYDDSYTVLERVLQPFSSTIKQSNGAYRITNYNEIESNVFVYDFSTLSFVADISSNSLINLDDYKFHASSDKTKIRPLRYVDLTFANKDMGGELVSDISSWNNPSIWTIGGEWTVESDNTLFIINETPGFDCSIALTTPFAVNYINGNEYMSLSLDMKIDPIPGGAPATSGDAIYLQVWLKEAAGSWTEAANWYVSRTVFYENYASTASPAWKIPGDTTYQMYLVITAPDDFNDMYIRIKNLSLTQVNYLDGKISEAVVFDKNFIGDIGINKDRHTDKIYFGDSDAITEISAITIGTLNLSSKWCLYGEDTSARIQELYTRNILRNNRKFRDYISLEVIDPSDHILPDSLIQIGSKVYTITDYYKNFSESPADNYVRLSIDELLTDDPSIFYFSQITLTSIDGESTAPTNNVVPSTGDHGALTGLGDDDHPQYLNNVRGDARYPSVSYIDGSLAILKSYVDTEVSYLEASINNTYDAGMWFVPEASFNDSYFKWVSGYLEPSIAGGGTGDVTKLYVDGSLAVRDARIAAINASLGDEDNILSYVNSSTYYDGSLNARVLKSGDTMTGALTIEGDGDQYLILDNAALGFAAEGTRYGDIVLAKYEDKFLELMNWASGEAAVATVLRISANTTSGKEATLALVRGDWPDVEFLDFYNNGYVDSSNYGIRIQKRGTGIFRDFMIDSYDGSTYTNGINIKFSDLNDSETLTTDIYSDVSISGKTYLNGDIYAEGSIGFTGDVSAGASLRFRNGILIEVLSGGSKPPALNAIPTIYYKMDDTSGNIKDALGIYDSSSTDSLSYSQSGKINTAIGFDQDAGGATIPVENSIFDFSSDSSLSVSFWVKPKTNWDIDYTARLYLGSVYSDYGLTLAHNTTGNVTFRWRDPNNKKHSLVRDISLGTYYYLTFTKLGTELKFYVDASLAFTSSESTYSSYSPATWNLGQGIMGDIDEFALFLGTALTESDVSALYNNGDGLAYPFN